MAITKTIYQQVAIERFDFFRLTTQTTRSIKLCMCHVIASKSWKLTRDN